MKRAMRHKRSRKSLLKVSSLNLIKYLTMTISNPKLLKSRLNQKNSAQPTHTLFLAQFNLVRPVVEKKKMRINGLEPRRKGKTNPQAKTTQKRLRMSLRLASKLKLFNLLSTNRISFRSSYNYPITFEHVVFPPDGQLKLPTMPPEPIYDENLGEKKYKATKRLIEARGFEPIHTELIHKQFGLVAANGGFIKAEDFAWIQQEVNGKLGDKQFAVWRVDSPWLPRVRRPPATKLGGGKGPIHHYETPVRPGRIILEVGGYITEQEARSILMHLYLHLPFSVEFISQELVEKRKELEAKVCENNRNKFDWETVIKYNMQNCKAWLSPYDVLWKCKYR